MIELTREQEELFENLQRVSQESMTSVVFFPKKNERGIYDELVKKKLLFYDSVQDGYSISPSKYENY